VGELAGVDLSARILIGELALTDGVEELDLVRLEYTEQIRESVTLFIFVLLC
jgi:hypothetical protein